MEYICGVAVCVSGLGGPDTEGIQRDIEDLLNKKAVAG